MEKEKVDVLVLFVGHFHGNFLRDNAEAFTFYHQHCKSTYRVAFAIDHSDSVVATLSKKFDKKYIFNSPEHNGWGKGILRTIAHSLDYFADQGIEFKHLITVDSDALVVGPLLDRYVALAEEDKVCFVGTKWGGVSDLRLCTPANPAPTDDDRRCHMRFRNKTKILYMHQWKLLDYLVAGPFMMWTRYCLDFMTQNRMLPGKVFDETYQYLEVPHDQMSSYILGVEGHRFKDVGSLAMLYCGNIGGYQSWKDGFPTEIKPPYGRVPVVSPGVSVIHPIRANIYDEAIVRLYFRNLRKKS